LVTAFIEPILIVTGLLTMGAITLFLLPQSGLKLLLDIETTETGILLLTRHWGLLLFLVGGLLVYSAFTPAIRVPVLIVAIAEKVVISAQLGLGLNPKTRLATLAVLFDTGCVVLYLLNIAGL
jgi:hypothetical protein